MCVTKGIARWMEHSYLASGVLGSSDEVFSAPVSCHTGDDVVVLANHTEEFLVAGHFHGFVPVPHTQNQFPVLRDGEQLRADSHVWREVASCRMGV